MGRLAIRQLKYEGEHYHYESPVLNDGVSIVEGPNGSGKTTFSALIYWCLGGKVGQFQKDSTRKHIEITSDKHAFAELRVEINQELFSLRRYFDSNDIGVVGPILDDEKESQVSSFPVNRTKDAKTFSDWLMEKLGINPIEITQGPNSFKLSIYDLFRLVYHNQAADPEDIYKAPDVQSFVTDSKELRKAIFEVLTGKSFHEYYREFGKLKRIDISRAETKAKLELFRDTIGNLFNDEEKNVTHIENEIDVLEEQLQRLNDSYEELTALSSHYEKPDGVSFSVSVLQKELSELALQLSEENERKQSILREMAEINGLKQTFQKDASHIEKILFTDEKLGLFKPESCPYCLSVVERTENQCICGTEVDEGRYQRLFYNPEEYRKILKEKLKSIETMKTAVFAAREELDDIASKIGKIESSIDGVRAKLKRTASNKPKPIEAEKIRTIEDKIIQTRMNLEGLRKSKSIEEQRQKLEDDASILSDNASELRTNVNLLFNQSKKEMGEVRKAFNAFYYDNMRKTLASCRTARIDDDYVPIINDNAYQETSAGVSKRLMYYLSLLQFSLTNTDSVYPKFLMVDTPETAGVDDDKLDAAISQLVSVLESTKEQKYQVILTTGVDKYPSSSKKLVVQTLSDDSKLLKIRN